MRMSVPFINRFFMLATAPFLGMLIWLLAAQITIELPKPVKTELPAVSMSEPVAAVNGKLDSAQGQAQSIQDSLTRFFELYRKSSEVMSQSVKLADGQVNKPLAIYDRRITVRLGRPIRHIESGKLDLELFRIHENNYSGYAMKVRLKSPKAMKMVLGKDKVGSSETTLAAAKRYGAVAAVNAGGFADQDGKRYPLSTTMINGKYANPFEPTHNNLFFVGLNKQGELIGGNFTKKSELDKLQPNFGASFVPILLKNGIKQEIPSKWVSSPSRAARTVMANYKDDQLLFLVTEGRDESGNSGATLLELQDKLKELGVVDAYNLDGGGSTSLIVSGSVINTPSDGRLRPLATHFLFFK